ncbi:MAG: hypothetical protein RI953_2525 [Pseudomonadota bacterium]|jgi:hypothetical protein
MNTQIRSPDMTKLFSSLFLRPLAAGALFIGLTPGALADTTKTFAAEYTFPVPDDSLKPFATHKIDSYKVITTDAGKTILTFAMPEDLSAGKKTEVSFEEVENNGTERVLKGDSGTIRCTIPWLTSKCQIEFSPMVVPDLSQTIDFVFAKYGFDDVWLDRLSAIDKFSTEPIGTVSVTGVANP